MKHQIERYRHKLIADGSCLPDQLAILTHDTGILASGNEALCALGRPLLAATGAAALIVATLPLPFEKLLLRHAVTAQVLVPPDIETRTFLHDIPLLRRSQLSTDPTAVLARHLGRRKGLLLEGVGLIATGPLTLEQAYINLSSLFHALFVKVLHDMLHRPVTSDDYAFVDQLKNWLQPLSGNGLLFCKAEELQDEAALRSEMERVGCYTVQQRLVDSFFGNISARSNERILISQTAASLDALAGCIDPVPFDNSSTCGITASSELLTHRRIYENTSARTILHGHPKFAVIMSMQCDHAGCAIDDCWRDCPQIRDCSGTPVTAGEVGAGGLADKVVPVIAEYGVAIVFGHGVFTTGRNDFAEPFNRLLQIEQACRDEYFRRIGATC